MPETNELAEISRGREVIYSFFSRTFIDPISRGYFEMLKELLPLMETMLDSENEKLKRGIAGLKETYEKRAALDGTDRNNFDTELLKEYTRLFCLGNGVAISESVYTSKSGLVMQESRDDMLRLFREAGLGQNPKYNEPEDHIGNEMSVMSWYCNRLAAAAEENDTEKMELELQRQKYLHEEHFAKWIDIFTENVRLFPRNTIFYNYIADFMEGFVEEDYLLLSEITGND